MLRSLFASVCVLVLCATAACAAEYNGKVQSVDAAKGTITVSVDGKERTFKAGTDLKVIGPKKRELPGKLKSAIFKRKPQVTLLTEGTGDKELVKEIHIGGKK